jgi:hypothetical protein
LNTPFINLQDGRMRPTGVHGIWAEIDAIPNIKIEGGWMYSLSPRGTTEWYSVGESIGLYSVGVNSSGLKSGYARHLKSKGVAMLGVHTQIKHFLKVQAWEMYVQNMFNTAMLQADIDFSLQNTSKFFAAGQVIQQNAIKEGGNEDPTKAYFTKDGKATTFGAKLGWRNKQWETSINYNRITSQGRYLMPREWGREQFLTKTPENSLSNRLLSIARC